MCKIDLAAAPFYLTAEDIKWVEETRDNMTLEEKIGQLFCPLGMSPEHAYLQQEIVDRHVGGILFRNGKGSEMQAVHNFLQQQSKIPLLIAANLEAGGDGIAVDGTAFGKQMEIAAADDCKHAYRLGKVSCAEGRAVGCNWAFAPVVDIDKNYHNPITNVRTLGDDPDKIIAFAKEYIRAAKEENVAVSIKHFPGDGIDERDQHLLTSINTLSCEEWDASYGRIYQKLIEAGSLTVMVGHIAMPAYEEKYSPENKERIVPASQSKALMQKVLREKLGFNGLIVSDATPMVGFCASMSRAEAVPLCIENGCDMFLFNKDLAEDIEFMHAGYEKGLLSHKRLEEAVTRILALKAALKLHTAQNDGSLIRSQDDLQVLRSDEHVAWARECADASVTLVKDTQKLLPLDVKKQKRVLLQILGPFDSNKRVQAYMTEKLTREGFDVYHYEPEHFGMHLDNVADIKRKYDLVLYIGNVENASNQTTARIQWKTFFGLGNNLPWFVYEVPTLFISLANPYHLLDVPMVKTFINAYSNNEYVMDAVVEKIMGRSAFKGKSPVDPFCGRMDTKY